MGDIEQSATDIDPSNGSDGSDTMDKAMKASNNHIGNRSDGADIQRRRDEQCKRYDANRMRKAKFANNSGDHFPMQQNKDSCSLDIDEAYYNEDGEDALADDEFDAREESPPGGGGQSGAKGLRKSYTLASMQPSGGTCASHNNNVGSYYERFSNNNSQMTSDDAKVKCLHETNTTSPSTATTKASSSSAGSRAEPSMKSQFVQVRNANTLDPYRRRRRQREPYEKLMGIDCLSSSQTTASLSVTDELQLPLLHGRVGNGQVAANFELVPGLNQPTESSAYSTADRVRCNQQGMRQPRRVSSSSSLVNSYTGTHRLVHQQVGPDNNGPNSLKRDSKQQQQQIADNKNIACISYSGNYTGARENYRPIDATTINTNNSSSAWHQQTTGLNSWTGYELSTPSSSQHTATIALDDNSILIDRSNPIAATVSQLDAETLMASGYLLEPACISDRGQPQVDMCMDHSAAADGALHCYQQHFHPATRCSPSVSPSGHLIPVSTAGQQRPLTRQRQQQHSVQLIFPPAANNSTSSITSPILTSTASDSNATTSTSNNNINNNKKLRKQQRSALRSSRTRRANNSNSVVTFAPTCLYGSNRRLVLDASEQNDEPKVTIKDACDTIDGSNYHRTQSLSTRHQQLDDALQLLRESTDGCLLESSNSSSSSNKGFRKPVELDRSELLETSPNHRL